jgi:REP element-mobilizing transposase RayT
LEIHGWVLMPSHLHVLCRSKKGFNLSDIIRDFKKFTSTELIRTIQEESENRREWFLYLFAKACEHYLKDLKYKVWQNGYHGEEISSNKFTLAS